MHANAKLPWALKLAAASGLQVFNMIVPQDLVITVLLAFLTVGLSLWGIWDLLGKVRICQDGEVPNSDDSKKYEIAVKRNILGGASLFIVLMAITVHVASSYKEQLANAVSNLMFVKMNTLNTKSHSITVTLDGTLLKQFHSSHDKAMVACRILDLKIDALDDSSLDKSRSHTVSSGDFIIQLDLGPETVSRMRPGIDRIHCFATLLPNGTPPDDIKSLRQLQNLNGIILGSFGAWAWGTPK